MTRWLLLGMILLWPTPSLAGHGDVCTGPCMIPLSSTFRHDAPLVSIISIERSIPNHTEVYDTRLLRQIRQIVREELRAFEADRQC